MTDKRGTMTDESARQLADLLTLYAECYLWPGSSMSNVCSDIVEDIQQSLGHFPEKREGRKNK